MLSSALFINYLQPYVCESVFIKDVTLVYTEINAKKNVDTVKTKQTVDIRMDCVPLVVILAIVVTCVEPVSVSKSD